MQNKSSAIPLEKNEKFFSSKRTKHIKTRYLFVMDILEQGDLASEHCTMESMWDDILTKPLQVKAFREFRAELMNFPVDYED